MSAVFVFAAVSLAFSAAGLPDYKPTGRWAKPTAELASELLKPDQAADTVGHDFGGPIFQNWGPTSVRFTGRPQLTGDGFFARKTYYVAVYSVAPTRAEPQAPIEGSQVRLGGCDGTFAYVNPGASLDQAKTTLRWLKWAAQAAESGRSLPFAVSCSDEMPYDEDRCASGARAALAALPIDKVMIITKDFDRAHRWNVSVTETRPGDTYWELKVDGTPSKSSIDLVWRIPAPF